jgi:hypothetical protein
MAQIAKVIAIRADHESAERVRMIRSARTRRFFGTKRAAFQAIPSPQLSIALGCFAPIYRGLCKRYAKGEITTT